MINKKIITTLAILLFNLSAINVAYAAETGELNFGGKANYIGEVKSGKAHGIGALQTTDGTNFIGKFNKNVVHGDGILIKLDANNALADLKISDNFPQLNKNEILGALTDFRDSWADLKENEGQLREAESGKLIQLKLQRQNLKKKFFESTYPEWWIGVSKKANNDEKLLLDEIQIFFGKWKNGIFTEYLDKKKNFRRQTKLKKLDRIGHDKGNNIIPIINFRVQPNFVPDPDVRVVIAINPVDGNNTLRVEGLVVAPGVIYNGEVNEDRVPNGRGTFINIINNDTYVGDVVEGAPGGRGTITFGDDGGILDGEFDARGGRGRFTDPNGSDVNITVEFKGTEDGVNINVVSGSGKLVDENGTFDGEFKGDIFDGTHTRPNGSVFVGEVNTETNKPVSGTRTFEDGSSFTGTFINGLPSNGTFKGVEGDETTIVNGKAPTVGEPPEFAKTWADGSTFSGTLDNRGLMSSGTYFDAVSGRTYEFKNGQNVTMNEEAEPKVEELIDITLREIIEPELEPETSAIIDSSVIQTRVNTKYYDATLVSNKVNPTTQVSSIDPLTLSSAVAQSLNDRKRRGGNKEKLKKKKKKIQKQLKKKKKLKPSTRKKLENRLKKINKELKGIAKSSGTSAGSIEITEAGQQQMDTDKAEATAAATGNNDSGGGGGGGS